MQNMISLNKQGKPVSAFFDVDWTNKRIENIVVRDGHKPVGLTDADLIAITGLIEAEVSAILMESALDKAEGKAVIA